MQNTRIIKQFRRTNEEIIEELRHIDSLESQLEKPMNQYMMILANRLPPELVPSKMLHLTLYDGLIQMTHLQNECVEISKFKNPILGLLITIEEIKHVHYLYDDVAPKGHFNCQAGSRNGQHMLAWLWLCGDSRPDWTTLDVRFVYTYEMILSKCKKFHLQSRQGWSATTIR